MYVCAVNGTWSLLLCPSLRVSSVKYREFFVFVFAVQMPGLHFDAKALCGIRGQARHRTG